MKNGFKTALILIVALVILGFGNGSLYAAKQAVTVPQTISSDIPMVPAGFSDLAAKVRAGVVNIQVVRQVEVQGPGLTPSNPFGDFFGPFGGNMPQRRQQGIGSGFVISADGFIVTNNHVVEDATQIKVKFADGKEWPGKVVGRDPKTDLALIKINPDAGLSSLTLGDSDALKVGEWVVAVGSPFGLEQTVTAGIVSAKGRVIGSGPYDDFIQTDASINPGNSGGPLINLRGEVVGINTAIIASGQGIGFAIPISMARDIVTQLQQKGHVTRGLLGVSIQDVTPELAKSFGMKEARGALVAQVIPDSPAHKGGIEQGDIILEFDGKKVSDSKALPRLVATAAIGRTVTVVLLRDGKEIHRQVKVGEMEEEAANDVQPGDPANFGVALQNLSPQIARQLGVKVDKGVVVTRVAPGSAAQEAGLQPGDVISKINREPVSDVADFSRKMKKLGGKESVLLLIHRGENSLFVAVKMR